MECMQWFTSCCGLCRRRASLLILGLDNGGKSTLVKQLKADKRPSQVIPTVGFSVEKFVLDGMALTVVDMSGQEKYVKLWESFYKDVQAVVFVVDSADRARLSTAKALLDSVLERPELAHLPLLVFANKVDLVHALPAVQVAQVLAVDRPGTRRAWHISASSALTGEGLEEGIKWLRERLRNS